MKRLQKGDTIGIINPAFKNPTGVTYPKMIEYLNNLGYKVKLGKTTNLEFGYLAGSDQDRIDDLEEMFLDQTVSCIICLRGGYGCSRIVDKINYDIIKNNPKLFIGFSDITVLLNSFYKHANLITIHGLIALYLGNTDSKSLNDFNLMTTCYSKNRILTYDATKTLNEGVCEGVLVGGNLTLISTLKGTDYEIDFTDKIVLIEDVEEEPYCLDKLLSGLRLSKALSKAKGFIIGYFFDCYPSKKREGTQTEYDIMVEYFKDLNVPVIYDFASGHNMPFISLPIGAKIRLDATNKKIEILEEIYETD